MKKLVQYTLLSLCAGTAGYYMLQLPSSEVHAQDKSALKSIAQEAENFLATLSPDELQKAHLSYDDPERLNWKFIPLETRKGLPLRDMNDAQRSAAHELFKTVVSQLGYEKANRIMSMENLLRQLEGPDSHARRDPTKYYFTVYGDPKATSPWGLSIEGHHVSLNFVIKENKIVEATPQFFAANPAEIKQDYSAQFKKGTQVLEKEEQLAYQLLRSLDDKQRTKAIVADESPAEIHWIDQPHAQPGAAQGVAVSELNKEQSDLLRSLVVAYTDSMLPDVAAARWKQIEEAGWDKTHFAWLGGTEPGIGHFYAIQGPSFLIEFVNTQPDAAGNPANHIHCVWRDTDGDFYVEREADNR